MSRTVKLVPILVLSSILGVYCEKFAFASDQINCGISYFNDTEHGPHRIYHGKEASLGQFPWLAAILRDGKKDCSGAIISEEYILTAGHCVDSGNVTEDRKVVVGSLTTGTGDTKLDVIEYSQHPKFDCDDEHPWCRNDVAVLKLANRLEFSNNIQPICLAASFDGDTSPKPEESAIVAGFGFKLPHGTESDTLLYGHEHFVDIETCAREHPDVEIDKKMHICADGKEQHTLGGDSGGPIFIKSTLADPETGRQRYVQVGINSFDSDPDVFSRVTSHCEFISKSTNGTVKCIKL